MKRLCMALLGAIVCMFLATVSHAWTDVGVTDYYRVKQEGKDEHDLVFKYETTGQPAILPGQTFAINLSLGFSGNFLEVGKKGEVAVIARVIERGSGKGGPEYGADAAKSGRLIYFSNDVHEKQHFSFSYLPVYGPLEYSGKPVDIQLYVIEIDDADKFKPLLHSLMKAGQGLYPPAAPILGLLDTLGSTLLTAAAKDDVMFDYSFSLWPQEPIGSLPGYQTGEYPVLEAGHYVFIRQQDRKNATDDFKDKLKLKSGNHKLVMKDKKTSKFNALYKEDYYLVLHIKRASRALSLEAENRYYKTFEKFRESQAASTEDYAKSIKTELDKLGAEFIQANERKSIYTLYDGVGAAVKGDEVYAKNKSNKLLHQLKSQINKRNKCDSDDLCGGALKKEELLEILALMRSTKAFKSSASKLTYEGLVNEDISAIVTSVGESLPKDVTDR